jgi:hypothetical protein
MEESRSRKPKCGYTYWILWTRISRYLEWAAALHMSLINITGTPGQIPEEYPRELQKAGKEHQNRGSEIPVG